MNDLMKKIAIPSAFAAGALTVAACVANQPPPAPATAAGPTTSTPATPEPAATTPATATATATAAATATATASPAASTGDPIPLQPAHQEVPPPPAADKPAELHFTVADGRPAGLKPGAPEAYYIWHDDHGKWWHVFTTTHSQLHRFQGWVWHDKDRFTDVKPSRMEWNDRIRYGEKGISWDFSTKGHEDGFHFHANGAQCVRFHTFIDGKPAHGGLVHIGAGGVHPPSHHFKLCP